MHIHVIFGVLIPWAHQRMLSAHAVFNYDYDYMITNFIIHEYSCTTEDLLQYSHVIFDFT